MPNFTTPDGELTDLFITDADILDRYVGNQLWMWGCNGDPFGFVFFGSLGNNVSEYYRSSPVQTVSGGTNWKQVTSAPLSAAAIKTDGRLWTWGFNGYGILGDNTTGSKSSPVQTIATGTNWASLLVGATIGAIKTDGRLWTWGHNSSGTCGDNTTGSKSSPVQTIAQGTNWKQVAVGTYGGIGIDSHMAAIKTDGTLWTWGYNGYGQLGRNNTTNSSSPVQTIAQGTNWKQVACGGVTTSAIKTDGTLWSWGSNGQGQLGDNTTVNKSSPVQTIAQGTNWKQCSIGGSYAGAIKTDGRLWMWGDNGYWGQLGTNNNTSKSSPVQTVAIGTNWKTVSVFSYSGAPSAGNYYPLTAAVTYTES